MRHTFIWVLLLLAGRLSAQQLSVAELVQFYHQRNDSSLFMQSAQDKGFYYAAHPFDDRYDGFIFTDTSTILLVHWGEDIIYTFKEKERFDSLWTALTASGFVRNYRRWTEHDEISNFCRDDIEIFAIRYFFRTPQIRYGIAVRKLR